MCVGNQQIQHSGGQQVHRGRAFGCAPRLLVVARSVADDGVVFRIRALDKLHLPREGDLETHGEATQGAVHLQNADDRPLLRRTNAHLDRIAPGAGGGVLAPERGGRRLPPRSLRGRLGAGMGHALRLPARAVAANPGAAVGVAPSPQHLAWDQQVLLKVVDAFAGRQVPALEARAQDRPAPSPWLPGRRRLGGQIAGQAAVAQRGFPASRVG
mmetsp:Transcript_54176/g.157367  ORF Transcript_54176/g.157367 Transcript_54176/m.157367 type:complete len:213 (+) Transcript_54176:507-1145(+)